MSVEKLKRLVEFGDLSFWDSLMVDLLCEVLNKAQKCANDNVQEIIKISKNFLTNEAHQSIEKFHTLYFDDTSAHQSSDQFNADISDFVEQAQQMLASGKDIESNAKEVLSHNEEDRLSLSQAQKQVEALIALESDLKEKLTPIIGMMQFEDEMRQRIEHITQGLKQIADIPEDKNETFISDFVVAMEKLCVSKDETQSFFKHVKKEEAPEVVSSGTAITF